MSLRDRLRRLDRDAQPPEPLSPAPAAQELRRRLDRLLGAGTVVTAAEVERRGPARERRPIEGAVPGRRVDTPAGTAFLCETLVPADGLHGRLPVGELGDLPGAAARLFPETLGDVRSPDEIAFLDTETTGLAGGAGTVPFLIGVARWSPQGLRIAQLFLEDLDLEGAQLRAFAEAVAGVTCVVTYNGGPYDIPLLENRHVLQRRPWPLVASRHLDLLPASRTLWKPRHPNCRLTTLEKGVLGHARRGDIPGAEIPGVYAAYLRRGADRQLAAVFEHNRLDLLSLAGLLWAAGRAAEGHRDEGPTAAAGAGLLHARRGRRAEARAPLEAGLGDDLPRPVRLKALKELALARKHEGLWREALEPLAELRSLAPAGDPFPYLEAARILERGLCDDQAALALVDEALARGPWAARDREALERRRARLARRVGEG